VPHEIDISSPHRKGEFCFITASIKTWNILYIGLLSRSVSSITYNRPEVYILVAVEKRIKRLGILDFMKHHILSVGLEGDFDFSYSQRGTILFEEHSFF
jgi:hypothetical protein